MRTAHSTSTDVSSLDVQPARLPDGRSVASEDSPKATERARKRLGVGSRAVAAGGAHWPHLERFLASRSVREPAPPCLAGSCKRWQSTMTACVASTVTKQ